MKLNPHDFNLACLLDKLEYHGQEIEKLLIQIRKDAIMPKKKKEQKPKKTYKEKLIEEAQKLIAVANIKGNLLYYFVKRDKKLIFIMASGYRPRDTKILQLAGNKILKGLEEYHWDVYGDAFVYNFPPEKEEKNDADDTENSD